MLWDRSKGAPEPIWALNSIRERENHEPLVNFQEVAPSLRIGRPTVIPYCRRAVALMAEKAAHSLPKGVFLAITDAWRPLIRQKMIYDWLTECAKEAYPGIRYSALRRKVNRWAAPYDQKAPPGHCTGAAIDVALVDDRNELIDVVSPYERFVASPTYTLGLTGEAHSNRMMLVEAMLQAGFSNCRDEWWHYSYGDAGWAVRVGEKTCFYGAVELPEAVYVPTQQQWEKALRERPNPFLTLLKR